MRTAFVSDIHGNLEALTTVLEDINRVGVDRIICLGDTVGYGPKPKECLDIIRRKAEVILLGNHEHAVLHGANNFTSLAARALDWTAARLRDPETLSYLASLSSQYVEGDHLYVHGSISDPTNDYVREADSPWMFYQLVSTLRKEFGDTRLCFVGHNHRTFLGTEMGYIFPHDDSDVPRMEFDLSDQKAYVSVGSVGQPRNFDPRASWVFYDGQKVTFMRVKYDWRKTADLILHAGLPEFLAERLQYGE